MSGLVAVSSLFVLLYVYNRVIHVKLPSLQWIKTWRQRARAEGSTGMTAMQRNRAVHIAFNRSMTSSLANRFYHLSGFGEADFVGFFP